MNSKGIALIVSGILGFVIPAYFGWTLYESGIPQSLAAWGMIFALDIIGTILVYKDGNKKPYLQLGWCVAAFCIVLGIMLGHSQWTWGIVETTSLILCGTAVVLWLTLSAHVAIWAQVAAMCASTAPIILDNWHRPQPQILWLWVWTIVTCLLAIYGSKKRDLAHMAVPSIAIVLNVVIAILCIR